MNRKKVLKNETKPKYPIIDRKPGRLGLKSKRKFLRKETQAVQAAAVHSNLYQIVFSREYGSNASERYTCCVSNYENYIDIIHCIDYLLLHNPFYTLAYVLSQEGHIVHLSFSPLKSHKIRHIAYIEQSKNDYSENIFTNYGAVCYSGQIEDFYRALQYLYPPSLLCTYEYLHISIIRISAKLKGISNSVPFENLYAPIEIDCLQLDELIAECRRFRCADHQKLSGKNLNDYDFSGLDLSKADFSGSDLRDARFNNSKLRGANFHCADFRRNRFDTVDFRDADLSGADFSGAHFNNVHFNGANLSGANFSGADFDTVDFRGADLSGANFGGADFDTVNFSGSDIIHVNFSGTRALRARFYRANVKNTKFNDSNLRYSDFSYAHLKDIDFSNSDFNSTNFGNANFENTDFNGANLFKANLSGASGLTSIRYNNATKYFTPQCPATGEFEAYKEVYANPDGDKCLVKLLVPEDALRSSATSDVCRCSKAKILSITDMDGAKEYKKIRNLYDFFDVYEVGKTIKAAHFNKNRWSEYGAGIMFCMNPETLTDNNYFWYFK